MPAEAGNDCTDCTVCTVGDNDDKSKIDQLDGCDSVSTSSTDSHSDTLSIADSYSPSFSEYNYDNGGTLDSDYSTYTTSKGSNIMQCDGADTASENSFSESIHNIQVVTNMPRPPRQDVPLATRTLTQIPRNPRVNASTCLPVVAVANVRSLLPKLNSFVEKIQNEAIEICSISEIWEKQGRKMPFFKQEQRK